jgi:hypothetical protein
MILQELVLFLLLVKVSCSKMTEILTKGWSSENKVRKGKNFERIQIHVGIIYKLCFPATCLISLIDILKHIHYS